MYYFKAGAAAKDIVAAFDQVPATPDPRRFQGDGPPDIATTCAIHQLPGAAHGASRP